MSVREQGSAESGEAVLVEGAAPPNARGLTRDVCEFIGSARLEDVPTSVLWLAKRSILDGLGLGAAGSRSRAATILRT